MTEDKGAADRAPGVVTNDDEDEAAIAAEFAKLPAAMPVSLRMSVAGFVHVSRKLIELGDLKPIAFMMTEFGVTAIPLTHLQDSGTCAQVLRIVADKAKAEWVAIIMEAWSLTEVIDQPPTEKDIAETTAKIREVGGVCNMPGARDCVSITIETLTEYWNGYAVVRDTGDGHKTFDDMKFEAATSNEGTLVGLLPRPSTLNS